MVDYPDGTIPITVLVDANFLSQFRNLPWWVRNAPNRILYLDDFEGEFKWENALAQGTVDKYASVFEGNYGMRLISPAAKDSYVIARKKLGLSALSKFAIQLRWSPNATGDAVLKEFFVQVALLGTDYDRYAVVRYWHHEGDYKRRWQYYDESGVMVDIPGASENIYTLEYRTHYLYFVFDASGGKFELTRLATDVLDLDLSGLNLYKEAASGFPGILLSMGTVPDDNAYAEAIVDCLCLSDQEL